MVLRETDLLAEFNREGPAAAQHGRLFGLQAGLRAVYGRAPAGSYPAQPDTGTWNVVACP